MDEPLRIGQLRREDLARWLELMRITKATPTGLPTGRVTLRCLGCMSLSDQRLVILTGTRGPSLVCSAGVALDPTGLWQRLQQRYPWVELDRVGGMLRRMLKRPKVAAQLSPEALEQYLSAPSGRSWGDSEEQLAAAIFSATHPAHRGSSFARHVLAAAIDEAWRRGARRVDARLSARNMAGVRLGRSLGFSIEQVAGGDFFCTMDLPRRPV